MVFNYTGSYADQVSLFASGSTDADMVTDNPGTWMIHCHVSAAFDHNKKCMFFTEVYRCHPSYMGSSLSNIYMV